MTNSKGIAKQFRPLNVFAHTVLMLGGLLLIYPIIFMFMAGMMSAEEYAKTVMGLFPIAKEPTFKNFMVLIGGASDSQVQTYYVNSILRTLYGLFWAMITSFLGGYVFARLRFKGRDTLFLVLLATQMIPGVVSVIPTFIEFARWPFAGGNYIFNGGKGILDSWWVYLIGGPSINIMGTFLVKQSLEKVPYELDEAAKIDGAGTFRIIFQILMPLQLPILAFIAITTSQGIWNDWTTPFFFTTSDNLQTLPAAISRMSQLAQNPMGLPDYPLMLTLGLGVTLPMLLLFFFFQRYIVQGLANAGIKG
ncbi:carbohydrate ABC transporter permease [Paenibacillus spongiae]|uniref:Carbohydrate ABC transporter permease n=1 Tax=Paenibacillus spongiae TaxID=2909671 RepID=A0ABY5S4E3_9BACL|nr:carbohydrate ABC transporter permease [Paenibacillus spongiae]UVI28771.1 carbohydrate ABC transporter permease [Paenibacillus spongiae]